MSRDSTKRAGAIAYACLTTKREFVLGVQTPNEYFSGRVLLCSATVVSGRLWLKPLRKNGQFFPESAVAAEELLTFMGRLIQSGPFALRTISQQTSSV